MSFWRFQGAQKWNIGLKWVISGDFGKDCYLHCSFRRVALPHFTENSFGVHPHETDNCARVVSIISMLTDRPGISNWNFGARKKISLETS